MFVLFLNMMRDSKIEMVRPVARAETEAELLAFLASEEVPSYTEDGWAKSYRKDGPLEWFNLPSVYFDHGIRNMGTLADWQERTRVQWEEMLRDVPPVP